MKVFRAAFLLGCVAWLPLSQAPGQKPKAEPPAPGLSARLEVDEHKHSFTVRFYLKNTSKDEIKVARGWGGSGLQVVPRFQAASLTITPPTYLGPPRRSMRPNYVVVPAGKEVLYGTFTMGYPPFAKERREKLTAYIRFRELKNALQTEPKPLKIPAWKGPK